MNHCALSGSHFFSVHSIHTYVFKVPQRGSYTHFLSILFFLHGLVLSTYNLSPKARFPNLTVPSIMPQRVLVIGAGPVGSLAALYAAVRGYEVEIHELRSGKQTKLIGLSTS